MPNRCPSLAASVQYLASFHQISADYEIYIFDLWGVIHDGVSVFPQALEVLQHLKAQKKVVLFLSNTPKRNHAAAQHLFNLGIVPDFYDGLYTSGEDCYQSLLLSFKTSYENLRHRFVSCSSDDTYQLQDIGYINVIDPSEADFLLCALTSDQIGPSLSPFYPFLDDCLKAQLPMLCANSDLEIIRQGKRYFCAGALADYYQKQGGRVLYHGKPSIRMYQGLFDWHPQKISSKNKILMIGDSLITDIQGAQNFGIDALLISSTLEENFSIHPSFLPSQLFPKWVMKDCVW